MPKNIPDRAEFMTSKQKRDMKDYPRTHQNCIDITGVARPGKTAKDRALRGKARANS